MFPKVIQEFFVPNLDVVNTKNLVQIHLYRSILKEVLENMFRSEYISQLVHRKGDSATRPIQVGELFISETNKKRRL